MNPKVVRGKPRQTPGAMWNFICGHSCVLPALGKQSPGAIWNSRPSAPRKGYWVCRPCTLKAHKKWKRGIRNLASRIKYLFASGRRQARFEKHAPPSTPIPTVLSIFDFQNGKCAACHGPINMVESRQCSMDHCHTTGQVRGFLCPGCNFAEGILKDYTDEQIQKFLVYRQHCKTLSQKESIAT